jgi:DNA-binding NarL/FixJ family response regulator
MVVEDHHLVSEALRDMLAMKADIEITSTVSSAEAAVKEFQEALPDVVLLDVKLAGSMNGIQAIKPMKAAHPGVKVIMLTMFTDPATVKQAIEAGADAYVSKGSSKETLVRAIEAVRTGQSMLDPNVTEGVFDQIAGRDPRALTDREMMVLQHISHGNSTRETASEMYLSEETVKTYLRQIFKKLGAKDRTEAVAEAFRRGLIH